MITWSTFGLPAHQFGFASIRTNWPFLTSVRTNGPPATPPVPCIALYLETSFAAILSQMCFGTMYVSPSDGSFGSGTVEWTTSVVAFGADATRSPLKDV